MKTQQKRLTLGLPAEVWDALASEAQAEGTKIGTYVRDLLITRAKHRKDKS